MAQSRPPKKALRPAGPPLPPGGPQRNLRGTFVWLTLVMLSLYVVQSAGTAMQQRHKQLSYSDLYHLLNDPTAQPRVTKATATGDFSETGSVTICCRCWRRSTTRRSKSCSFSG